MRTLPVSCNKDCGGGCPQLAHIQNGRLVKITNNPLRNPHMTGCVKGFRMPEVLYAKDRLKRPLLQTGFRGSPNFKEISWNEALDRIAERLAALHETDGCTAVFAVNGSGSCRGAVHHTGLLTQRFFSLFGGYTGRVDSYSSAAAAFAEKYLFGTRNVGLDPPTLTHSKLIVLWGANICDTRFSSRLESILRTCKKKGVPIIVVDPRRSSTVKRLSTQWIPIRPGTDTAMMAAVLSVLLKEGWVDRTFTERYAKGFDRLASYLEGKTDGIVKDPEWAEPVCGVSAETISWFARTYGNTKPAALLPGLSIQRTLGGEETYRFTVALQAATGNIGQLGGSSGGEIWGKLPVPAFPHIPVPTPSSFAEIPVYRWPDAVLEGRSGGYPAEIKAVYNCGGNYINQGSDIRKSIRAFEKLGFAVTHDLFLTPTARYSDIVLPVTTFLEREDVVFPADNFLFYSAKAVEPLHETKTDYDIFRDLSARLGFGKAFSENRTSEAWLDVLIKESAIDDVDAFKTSGILRGEDHMRTAFRDFVQNPRAHPLPTPSGKIEIESDAYGKTGFSQVPECRNTLPNAEYPLNMITPHSRYRINSQNSNMPWIDAVEPRVLVMNRDDGKARGIRSGGVVRVFSREGEMEIRVRLTKDIIRGTVCLPQGAWTEIDARGVETGGSANILTSTEPTLPCRGARTHSVFVQVEKR